MNMNLYIESIKRDIEDKFNHSFKSATDFDRLETLIKNNSTDTLNASTLKRIWGYSKTDSKPRRTTLTVLAKVLGFRDWESYVEKKRAEQRIESGFISNSIVNVSDLIPGDRVCFTWNPNRSIALRCVGKETFEVIKQENSSLRVGDIFRILYLQEGYPIYCKDVRRDNISLGDYVAGEETGIRELQFQSNKKELLKGSQG